MIISASRRRGLYIAAEDVLLLDFKGRHTRNAHVGLSTRAVLYEIYKHIVRTGREIRDGEQRAVGVIGRGRVGIRVGLDDALHQFLIGRRGPPVTTPTVTGIVNDLHGGEIAGVV